MYETSGFTDVMSDTHRMLPRLGHQHIHALLVPVPQHLLHVQAGHGLEHAGLVIRQVLLRLHNLRHIALHTRRYHLSGAHPVQPRSEHLPADRARGHLELDVVRVVHKLEHRVRRVVARPVAVLVDARVPARPVSVPRGEGLEELACEGVIQQEGVGAVEGGAVAVLRVGNYLSAGGLVPAG